jgi:hypothetical protein
VQISPTSPHRAVSFVRRSAIRASVCGSGRPRVCARSSAASAAVVIVSEQLASVCAKAIDYVTASFASTS